MRVSSCYCFRSVTRACESAFLVVCDVIVDRIEFETVLVDIFALLGESCSVQFSHNFRVFFGSVIYVEFRNCFFRTAAFAFDRLFLVFFVRFVIGYDVVIIVLDIDFLFILFAGSVAEPLLNLLRE